MYEVQPEALSFMPRKSLRDRAFASPVQADKACPAGGEGADGDINMLWDGNACVGRTFDVQTSSKFYMDSKSKF
eukprot:1157998-Pelagomonas_calceolata.AAC.5